MADLQAPPLTVVRPGEGRAGELGGVGVIFKLWGHDTGGTLSIVEHPFAVGALVEPHTHTREDEYSIVGATGFEPVTSSVSDPTSQRRPVHGRVEDREGSMESRM